MTFSRFNRDDLLKLSDQELLAHCRVSTRRGSGKGGQKRNVTESAVQLTLNDFPDISVSCDDTRSQQRNRSLALRRLRAQLALQVRQEPNTVPPTIDPRPSEKNPDYPLWLGAVLDWLEADGYRIGDTARRLGLSTGRLARLLAEDPGLWRHINQERSRRGLKPLKS